MKIKIVKAFSIYSKKKHVFVLTKTALVEDDNHYAAKRSQFRKIFRQPAFSVIRLNYGVHGTRRRKPFDPAMFDYEQDAQRTTNSLTFGCMVFRGVNYSRLRSWATSQLN